jgi:hypothetical protein
MRRRPLIHALALALALCTAGAQELALRTQVLGFGLWREPADSVLNRNNTLEISSQQLALHLRPDLSARQDPFELFLKPRLELTWDRYLEGVRGGEREVDHETYLNEGGLRLRAGPGLFLSYARENLQWGPSFLLSPSNPFQQDNGKDNPWLELPGLDYARLVWIPSTEWSLSLIANTDPGRKDFLAGFRRTYAVKLDHTGWRRYLGLIGSRREGDRNALGFYGGYTVSDPLIVYAEGNLRSDEAPSLLLGGSYTLSAGPTLTAELYRNGAGCDRSPLLRCFFPRLDTDPDQALRRRRYVMLQYLDTDRLDGRLDLSLRWTRSLDEHSGILTGTASYELGEHSELFGVLTWTEGGPDRELGTLIEHSLMAGVRLSY